MVFGSGLPAGNPTLYKEMTQECQILTSFDKKRILLDNALSLFQIEAEVE
jgi:predicted TIM-barrel fold metal-dependent hydrolase